MNLFRTYAPHVPIAFNSVPLDTLDAIKRVVPVDGKQRSAE